ncbi:hypothetical protein G5S34_20115 [Herbaspirillum frisingense]|uniref:hypothetical protein n=1 Tax=Herbaspirillum frisingense TaxID=92645 RepID=UPI00160278F1|nr:hypothetical protein [Herbaspirillum frisingense]QNB08832.1 hypothetical protein G5S34_20115 [Herbaspirillum frisingense]
MMMSLLLQIAREAPSATSGGGVDRAASGDGRAWQREMERAQMQGWLQHGPAGQGGQAPDLAESMPAQAAAGGAVPRPLAALAASLGLGTQPAQALPLPTPGNGVGRPDLSPSVSRSQDPLQGFASAIAERAALHLPTFAGDDTASASLVAADFQGSAAKSMALPRITLERVGAGMRVWLGVDGGEDVPRATVEELVRAIHEVLDGAGVQLDSVICNGRILSLPHGARQAGSAFPAYFEHQGRT